MRSLSLTIMSLPKITKKISSTQADYIVVACGYTGRLVKHYLDLGAKIRVKVAIEEIKKCPWLKNKPTADYTLSPEILENAELSCDEHKCDNGCNKLWGRNYQNEYDEDMQIKDYQQVIGDVSPLPISIFDYLYGDGLYLFGDPNNDPETLEVNHILEDHGSNDLVFKNIKYSDITQIIGIIQQLRHCACFFGGQPYQIRFIEFINSKGELKTILILDYDTESG